MAAADSTWLSDSMYPYVMNLVLVTALVPLSWTLAAAADSN